MYGWLSFRSIYYRTRSPNRSQHRTKEFNPIIRLIFRKPPADAEPSFFEEDNQAAEIYRFEKNFHNQLKARLLEHRAVIQILRETTIAPDDFRRADGKPLRQLEDPARVAWNLTTSTFYKAGGQPWRLGAPRKACAM